MMYIYYPHFSLYWLIATIVIVIVIIITCKYEDVLIKKIKKDILVWVYSGGLSLALLVLIFGSVFWHIPQLYRFYKWENKEIVRIVDMCENNSYTYEKQKYRIDYKDINQFIHTFYIDSRSESYNEDVTQFVFNAITKEVIIPYMEMPLFQVWDVDNKVMINIYNINDVDGKNAEITYADAKGFIHKNVKCSINYTENEKQASFSGKSKKAVFLYSNIGKSNKDTNQTKQNEVINNETKIYVYFTFEATDKEINEFIKNNNFTVLDGGVDSIRMYVLGVGSIDEERAIELCEELEESEIVKAASLYDKTPTYPSVYLKLEKNHCDIAKNR